MSVRLTVDGREVEVPQGASVLDAGRKLGADIPTMCHRDGVEPAGSCFLCVVRVEGKDDLVPSCVCPAEEGMVVTTDSEEIREARRIALELLLSDHRGDCEAPCTVACPAGVDIPEFIRHIRDGNDLLAEEIIKRRIPLPGALGRICPQYCERVCRRQEFDEPIAICALKRYPADVDYASEQPFLPARAENTGKSVAIVGAGPAGLSAAWYLLQKGHSCTVIDEHEEPGGMLRWGIPDFRMPSHVVQQECEAIQNLGASMRLNTRVGRDVGIGDLVENFDAVLLATGAQRETQPTFTGGQLCASGREFLEKVARAEGTEVGERAVVIGDGDTAVAAARSLRRLGAKKVSLCSEERPDRTPRISQRVAEAESEGVSVLWEAEPMEVVEAGEQLELHVDLKDEAQVMPADMVVWAPARTVETVVFDSLELNLSRGAIWADRETTATSQEGVFAAGEVSTGPAAAVRTVAAGRRAAISIDQFLRGESVRGEVSPINVRMGKLSDGEKEGVFTGHHPAPRANPDVLPVAKRPEDFTEIQRGFSVGEARAEAERCLECDCMAKDDCRLRELGTEYGARTRGFSGDCRELGRETTHPEVVYESGKCILCGLCVRISEQREELGMSFMGRGFGTRARVPFGVSIEEGLPDGLARECAEACPTGALQLREKKSADEN